MKFYILGAKVPLGIASVRNPNFVIAWATHMVHWKIAQRYKSIPYYIGKNVTFLFTLLS
jgi:hypothetical protein